MSSIRVTAPQRFSRARPCPICGGHPSLPSRRGIRCVGFISADGRYAHCTREEYAAGMAATAATPATYPHRLDGPCKCGQMHGPDALPQTVEHGAQRHRRGQRSTTYYRLYDASGQLVGVHVRVDSLLIHGASKGRKRMWWEHHDGRAAEEMPLYGLTDLLQSASGSTVYVTEGEKARDALASHGVIAVATVTGAGGTPCDATLLPLKAYDVILWPDNDSVGESHMDRIAARLRALGASCRRVAWGQAPTNGDAADYFSLGGNADALPTLISEASHEPTPDSVAGLLLSQAVAVPVLWLWPGHIPMGKITVIDGNPGLGKSLITLDLAARLSTGRPMPDGTGSLCGGVILLSAEDDPQDTIKPRFDAAGGDGHRVLMVQGIWHRQRETGEIVSRPLVLPADVLALEGAIARVAAKLLIIDPLMAYLDHTVNAHRDQDVRGALAPLAQLAQRTGVAILIVRHLNKSNNENPLYRGGGSIGIIGAARSGLLVAADPDDPERTRILAATKCNLGPLMPSLRFTIQRHDTQHAATAHIEWMGACDCSAGALLSQSPPDADRTALAEAGEFLRQVLASGARPVLEILDEARTAGVSRATLRRARKEIGVSAIREGYGKEGIWRWQLAASLASDQSGSSTAIGAHVRAVSLFDTNEHLWLTPDATATEPDEEVAEWMD